MQNSRLGCRAHRGTQPIIPIRRAEGSGDTFIFTQFLTFSDPVWGDNYGYGTTITWPAVPGSLAAIGNAAMVEKVQKTENSWAYIGVSHSPDMANARQTRWGRLRSASFCSGRLCRVKQIATKPDILL